MLHFCCFTSSSPGPKTYKRTFKNAYLDYMILFTLPINNGLNVTIETLGFEHMGEGCLVPNIYNKKFTFMTIFQNPVQWHEAHWRYDAIFTSSRIQNFCGTPHWNSAPHQQSLSPSPLPSLLRTTLLLVANLRSAWLLTWAEAPWVERACLHILASVPLPQHSLFPPPQLLLNRSQPCSQPSNPRNSISSPSSPVARSCLTPAIPWHVQCLFPVCAMSRRQKVTALRARLALLSAWFPVPGAASGTQERLPHINTVHTGPE